VIEITEKDFSLDEMVRRAKARDAGAVVTFLGTVRDDGIRGMEIEAYREAAIPELERIRDEAARRFNLSAIEVVHRVGSLSVGENIVAIVCSAAHRDEAFQGCRYVIEELKSRAPIWKKEITDDESRWVDREGSRE
jgi:molybdopterin synthase catalytic subunit